MRSVPGADHHGVHARAQRVEELAVGEARDRPRAAVHRRAAVARVDHVHRDVRALRRGAPAPTVAAAPTSSSAVSSPGVGQQPAQRDGRLVAGRRHVIGWPGSMASLTAWKNTISSPGAYSRLERIEQEADVVAEVQARLDRRRRTSSGSRRGSAARAGPRCHAQRSNLSMSSPVLPPNSSASSACARGMRCTASASAISARRYVRFSRDRQARKRGGSKLRLGGEADHAAFTPIALAAVTMNSG